ncbi:MAG: FAD-binding protein [Gammaproteobacteria bacterium]|uniref:FAD-dependent oxidoreductase n=1 Tax=Rhodoferax sp. TaxID=50421 RepID=UPI0017D53F3E|nr:FAD-dependent oxidoreductase [Rhodoferax sp.]MBU3900996.1 FAD-binding protein [Gammaproteobacteria bacterium]MBA3058312.1 FAD-binding protein [Rhodoferax sp.]MBU3996775.1 FAD-binding protein [Gammaproteobacteria bacterium]MBU4017670.1 FAD-binding protein [Gammaproteobacteria bacterium]MBU4081113.1 FAD-binding protein [Gammaproteobacteria bacterium]
MTSPYVQSDVLVIGGGLAGIVAAIECLRAGKSVTLVDRDTPERLGGLALWAVGGMALVDTPLQRRMKLKDSPELALADWLRFGELGADDVLPRQWASYYVQHSREQVYDWVIDHGLKFMPAVNWVERGMQGDGNTLPRYHVVWGTSRHLTLRMIEVMQQASTGQRLTLLSRHRITALDAQNGTVTGATGINQATGEEVRFSAQAVVLAMGGINGSHAEARANWVKSRPLPATMLNGAHPFADGKLHHLVAGLGGNITHAGEMWNYAAGFPHPQPHFEGHGLSTIPCKSALWLNHKGERIGPQPLVTSFDTHDLCQRVAAQDKPYTCHLMNWRIAVKEFAISGAEHNQRIRDLQFALFLKETLLGNHRLVKQMAAQSKHFLVDDTLAGLAAKMNALAGTQDVKPEVLQATADTFDANFSRGDSVVNDDQIRRIEHARHWGPDKLRTCKPAPLQKPGAGPYIAIQMQLITRKSLGGLQTDLQSRVLNTAGQAMPGLYCVGEAAGFGGGGASGKRSLEGTFLPGCILTARAAARSIIAGRGL